MQTPLSTRLHGRFDPFLIGVGRCRSNWLFAYTHTTNSNIPATCVFIPQMCITQGNFFTTISKYILPFKEEAYALMRLSASLIITHLCCDVSFFSFVAVILFTFLYRRLPSVRATCWLSWSWQTQTPVQRPGIISLHETPRRKC